MKKTIALLGSWGWYGANEESGISVCEYEEGCFETIAGYYKGVVVGSCPIITSKNMVYFVNETRDTVDLEREGGYVFSAKLDRSKKTLTPMQRIKTYSTNPCSCAIDSKEEYLLIAHHASGQDYACKIYRDEKGTIKSRVEYDDAAIELIEIKESGELGEILDFDCHEPAYPGKRSFVHGIFKVPGNDLFIAVDKGLNRIYTYGINRNLKRLILLDELEIQNNAAPKYLGFVPQTALIYVCYELDPSFAIVRYNTETGKLTHIKDCPLQVEGHAMLGGQDFCFHPTLPICYGAFYGRGKRAVEENYDVKTLNNSWSRWAHEYSEGAASLLCAYEISDPENPKLIQSISTQSKGCRRISMTPDNQYILTLNTSGNTISRFALDARGRLTFEGMQEWHSPENVTYYEIDV